MTRNKVVLLFSPQPHNVSHYSNKKSFAGGHFRTTRQGRAKGNSLFGVVEISRVVTPKGRVVASISGIAQHGVLRLFSFSTLAVQRMPTVKAPDGRDMFTSFEPESEYHGGPGSGKVIRKFNCGMYYEGHYADDQENGYGSLTMSDGSTYEGEWKDGLFHGQGSQTWPSGSSYVGQYVAGRREGYGTHTLAANHLGKRIYTGQFVNNQRHGWGTYTVEKPTRGGTAVYDGEWDRDYQTGKGYLLGAEDPGVRDQMAPNPTLPYGHPACP